MLGKNASRWRVIDFFLVGLVAGGTVGCAADRGEGDVSSDCSVQPFTHWSAPHWDSNVAEALGLRARIAALTGDPLMRGIETGAVTASAADLAEAFAGGDPSLQSLAHPAFRRIVADAFEEFITAVEAGPRELVGEGGDWDPGAAGGLWSTSTRAFNEGGLEPRQIVDKGAFGGVLYGFALGLTMGAIDDACVDALAAAFGANSGLNPGRTDAAVEGNRNTQSANYVFQMGLYASARRALIEAKAYAADVACEAERDRALQGFFRAWERGLFARVVFYSNAGAAEVAAATDDDGLAAALHQQSEGIGLALGLYALPEPERGPLRGAARLMTDSRIEALLAALGLVPSGDLGAAGLGGFVSDPLGYADAVREVEAVIAEAFNLTEADLESYRAPTDG